ncbi:MAG: hypothetical protein JW809_19495 [Pirellulales bacterium]|nr:hypothetical protein [Pirellulales bacterium]
MSERTITIENIGPVERLTIPVPADGGVVVLHGRNGAGKTQALAATQALLRGSGGLDRRDGALAGSVAGFGASIAVAKSTRRTGQLEAVHLEGKLNVADLVDPGLKDPVAADAHRIKALLTLTGVEADPTAFARTIGEPWGDVSRTALAATDPVDMARRAKQDLQEAARFAETDRDNHAGRAAGLREAAGDLDESGPSEETAQEALSEALRAADKLGERRAAGLEAHERAREARARLDEAEANYSGPTVEEANEKVAKVAADVQSLRDMLASAEHKLEIAQERCRAAKAHAETIATAKSLIDQAGRCAIPTEEEIEEATTVVERARADHAKAVAQRDAREKLGRAKGAAAMAEHAAKRAARYREAARLCDEVLGQAIQCQVLRVVDGRLVTDTARGETYYAELSDGERWKIAIDVAAEHVGQRGVLIVPQDAWEGLDAENRFLIARHARARRVVILTAEAQREGEPAGLTAAAYQEA